MKYNFKKQFSGIGSLVVLFIFVVTPVNVMGNENGFSKQETIIYTNAAGLTAVTLWGIANWDYFQNDMKKADEGWFSQDTKSGGQDKLGHFYFSYTLSHILSSFYEKKGFTSQQGAFWGSLSSFGIMSAMEVGDSFSSYGFSQEDFLMNIIGSATGYYLYAHPALSEKIDLRIEYSPDFDEIDFFTDYDNQKFLMALKLDGFDFAQKNFLKYLELHLGYYTRGYSHDIDKKRNIYIGIGINISRVFKKFSMPKTSRFFNYIQVPYTYISTDKNFNK